MLKASLRRWVRLAELGSTTIYGFLSLLAELRPHPIPADQAPNGSLFVDSADEQLKWKTRDGTNIISIEELFTSVSNGKTNIAAAITDMGQSASGSDTFDQLATAIRNISTDATASASNILSGKTAYSGGSKITGTMPNRGAYNITPGTSNKYIPAGYHNGSGVVYGDANLVPGNIKDGVSIFGVVGNLIPGIEYASGSTTSSTISAEVGFRSQVIIVRNTAGGGAWFITDSPELPYRALDVSHVYQTYYNNCIYMRYDGYCYRTDVSGITDTGFSITLPNPPTTGTYEWIAYAYGW